MRNVLTTLAELGGIWLVAMGITAAISGPTLVVGLIFGGLCVAYAGFSERP